LHSPLATTIRRGAACATQETTQANKSIFVFMGFKGAQ
jgi:hypothetical protein